MQERWVGKNINLSMLCERIKNFFIKAGFKASILERDKKFEIFCVAETGEVRSVRVVVEGEPDDFTITFENFLENDMLLKISSFASMIGLGFLVRKKIVLLDLYRNLEEKFWLFITESIAGLSCGHE
jgi:hypothetical protein